MASPNQLSTLLTARSLGKVLGVGPDRVWQLAREGRIPCVRFGRAYRFSPLEIQRWLEAGGTRSRDDGHAGASR